MKFFFFAILFSLSAQAQTDSLRRVADLQEGSKLLIQLNDPEMLNGMEKKWQKGTEFDGTRCKMIVASHFDRELAIATGETLYTIIQIHNQNYFSARGEIRDQFTIWLTTENKDLPRMGLDCFRMTMLRRIADRALTLGSVALLLQQPKLWATPIFSSQPSKLIGDQVDSFSKITTTSPLHFTSVETSRRGQYSVTQPNFQNGKVVEKSLPNIPGCYANYSGNSETYDVTVPVGSEFRFEYISAMQFQGSEMVSFRGVAPENIYLGATCNSRTLFNGFAEVKNHTDGVINLE